MSIRSPLFLSRWLLSLLIVGAAFSVAQTFAQTEDDEEFDVSPIHAVTQKRPLYVGPCVGYNRVSHSADLASFPTYAQCPTFDKGSGSGYFAGLTVEYVLGDYKTSKSSLIFKLMYNTMPGSFTKAGDAMPTRVLQDGEMKVIITNIEHKNEVKYNLFTFEPLYKSNFFKQLGYVVGPSLGFSMTNTKTQTLSLVAPTPDNVRFDITQPDIQNNHYIPSDDKRTLTIENGDIKNVSKFRLGIKFGLQYEILMKGYYLVPNISYNYGVTQLSGSESWRVSALQIGVDIRFPLFILHK